jgi:hypothetical protein
MRILRRVVPTATLVGAVILPTALAERCENGRQTSSIRLELGA